MFHKRRPSITSSSSFSSASSAPTELKVEPALVLYLLTVHLESGSHSQIYDKTQHGLVPRFYVQHGAGTFSRTLHLGDASAASPIVSFGPTDSADAEGVER